MITAEIPLFLLNARPDLALVDIIHAFSLSINVIGEVVWLLPQDSGIAV